MWGSVRGAKTRKKKEGSLVFPNDGSTVECFWGSAVIGGWRSGWFGGALGMERGAGRLFKGWLFALLVRRGLRSSVRQNGPSN